MYSILSSTATTLFKKKSEKMPDLTTEAPASKGMGIGDIAKGAIGPVVSAGLGLLLEGHNNRQQIKQQQKLTDMQSQANRDQAQFSSDLQYDMWNKTNYENQVKHMNAAGINPALLYGGGGGGGTTTGSATAAGVSGGNAQQNTGAIQQAMGIGLQTAAQIALLKAQTDNIKADTAEKLSKKPVNDASVPLIQADTEGKNIDNKFQKFLKEESQTPEGQTLAERGVRIEQNKNMGEINNLGQQFKKMVAETGEATAKTNLITQEYEKLKQMTPMEVERYAKELEVWKRDPANSEGAQWANMLTKILGNFFGIKIIGH